MRIMPCKVGLNEKLRDPLGLFKWCASSDEKFCANLF
jgi:hypothetical protein